MSNRYNDVMTQKQTKKILIFHIGQLGDTLVAVPSLHVIRNHFHEAHLTLLCESVHGNNAVCASNILKHCDLVEDFILFPKTSSKLLTPLRLVSIFFLILRLLVCRFDTLIYIAPTRRDGLAVKRDIRFFRLAGISNFVGADGFAPLPEKIPGGKLPSVPHEGRQLLTRLSKTGMEVPSDKDANLSIDISHEDRSGLDQWHSKQGSDGGRKWIAVGIGSKMPVKIWPQGRYREVLSKLIDDFDVWPVFFGGPDDKEACHCLASKLKRGSVAAGYLGVRQSMAAMEDCFFYLGNDTGTMHMAVSAGLKCVAIFSSRDYPGKWYPWGQGHHVLRTSIECENCMLLDCVERKKQCIMSITVDMVYNACAEYLKSTVSTTQSQIGVCKHE